MSHTQGRKAGDILGWPRTSYMQCFEDRTFELKVAGIRRIKGRGRADPKGIASLAFYYKFKKKKKRAM